VNGSGTDFGIRQARRGRGRRDDPAAPAERFRPAHHAAADSNCCRRSAMTESSLFRPFPRYHFRKSEVSVRFPRDFLPKLHFCVRNHIILDGKVEFRSVGPGIPGRLRYSVPLSADPLATWDGSRWQHRTACRTKLFGDLSPMAPLPNRRFQGSPYVRPACAAVPLP